MKWLPYPMVRIAGFFTGGILLGIYFPEAFQFKIVSAVIALFTTVYFIATLSSKENKFPLVSGLLGLSVILLLGFTRLILSIDSNHEDHLSNVKGKIEAYEAIIRSVPQAKAKSWKIEVELTSVKTENWQPVTGHILLYVSKKNLSAINWHYGDHILVNGSPQEVRPPANPGEFDFKRFLSFKNISHQQFVQPEDVKFIYSASRKGFIYYSHQARAWSMSKLNQYVHGEKQLAIVSALVLGVTDGIDNNLQNAYAASGAMHVLAVSGMHVGIIYAIVLFLLKPLSKYKWSKGVVALVSLLFLWAFAFVTGLSPSVLRAVTMFSFIALARPFGMRTNIYNTLAASAFVLLIYNPYLIMSVGFQLSYLAVLGIVYLQRPLYNLWEIQNRLGDWIWQLTCVSIAAQIATFALGLLYFHQFPIYFLISNLFVIPLATLVLVIGIFLLAISFLSPLASLVGMALENLIRILNWIVFKTEALPFSLINNIHLTVFQCWLLMGILVMLILLFEFKSIKWLYASFGLALGFGFLQWSHFLSSVDQRHLIVYSVNGHHALEYVDSGRSYFVTDSALQNDKERIRFHIQPNRLAHGVTKIQFQIPSQQEVNGISYFRINQKTIGWISSKGAKLPLNGSTDYLLVSNNSLSRNSINTLHTNTVIFDGSNSRYYVQALMEEAGKRNIEIYSTAEHGAYIF